MGDYPPGGNLGENLATLCESMTRWNKTTFGNIYHRKKRANARLRGIQCALAENPTSRFLFDLQTEIQNELLNTLNQEEALWFAKSRVQRLQEGDRNTSFFHRSVLMARQSNRILSLRDNVGNVLQEPQEIRDHIANFFLKLYTTEQNCSAWPSKESIPIIHIDHPLSDLEIRNSLFSMHPNKAPGPDGLHPIFFQKSWDLLGQDVCKTIHEWFSRGEIPESMCEAIICLIPKQ